MKHAIDDGASVPVWPAMDLNSKVAFVLASLPFIFLWLSKLECELKIFYRNERCVKMTHCLVRSVISRSCFCAMLCPFTLNSGKTERFLSLCARAAAIFTLLSSRFSFASFFFTQQIPSNGDSKAIYQFQSFVAIFRLLALALSRKLNNYAESFLYFGVAVTICLLSIGFF